MRCPLAMAVLLAGLVLPSTIDAQSRSTWHSFASGPRMATGFAPVRSARGPLRTGMMRPAPSSGWRRGFGVGRRRAFSFAPWFSYGQPLFVPYFWNSPAGYQPVEEPTAGVPEQDDALVSQVERLTDEVESLREEQASRNDLHARAVAPQAAVQEKPVPTILVYRDGHQGEVQNYAILGQTLFVFADQTTRRVSLADLDLQATKRLNDERGVDFVPPHLP